MADVVFIYPKTGFDVKQVSVELPLSVIHASSRLHERGYKVKIIDQRMDESWERTLSMEIRKNPLFVGISAMTGSQIHFGLGIAKAIRAQSATTKIVWGGVHPTLLPVETARNEYVDIVVIGEGEEAAFQLAEALEKGLPLRGIPGIAYKEAGLVRCNPDRIKKDINSLPATPYALVDVRQYLKRNGGLFSAVYSRGCPFGCAFCCNPVISNRKWTTLETSRIIADLEIAHGKYHFKRLKFNDENFFVSSERVEAVSRAINDKYEWECQARIDSVSKFDFGKLRKRGLYQIQPGIESGNDRILRLLKKGLTRQRVLDYNKALVKTGIIATYNFMMGFPTETVAEVNDSVSLALRLVRENPNAEISAFYIYVPYPGCELYSLGLRHGLVPPKDLEGWAAFNRQQLYTPWIKDRVKMLKNIALTSKFIDGRRMGRLFQGTMLPKFIPGVMAGVYQKRWDKRDFKNHLDVMIVENMVNKVVKMF